MPQQTHLSPDEGESLDDASQFHQLVGRLIYVIVTRPDIMFIVHCLIKFLHNPLRHIYRLQ